MDGAPRDNARHRRRRVTKLSAASPSIISRYSQRRYPESQNLSHNLNEPHGNRRRGWISSPVTGNNRRCRDVAVRAAGYEPSTHQDSQEISYQSSSLSSITGTYLNAASHLSPHYPTRPKPVESITLRGSAMSEKRQLPLGHEGVTPPHLLKLEGKVVIRCQESRILK